MFLSDDQIERQAQAEQLANIHGVGARLRQLHDELQRSGAYHAEYLRANRTKVSEPASFAWSVAMLKSYLNDFNSARETLLQDWEPTLNQLARPQ